MNQNITSITSSAMLTRLSIGVYTGRKLDKKVSDEVAVNKGAHGRVGNYNKSLFADSAKLDKIIKLGAKIRNWHHANTLPWEDEGARLLPTKQFFDYRAQMSTFEQEFDQAVKDFLDDYHNQIGVQAFKLGAMFDKDEYPSVEELRRKFYYNVVFTPVPEVGDFRVDIAEETKKELMEQYEKAYEDRLQGAMSEAWGRLKTALDHIVERLTPDKDGDPKIFHKTMLEGTLELCDLLSKLNVTGDANLEQARKEVENMLTAVTPKELRESDAIRADVKNRVQEILGKMGV